MSNIQVVNYFEIVCKVYHDTPVQRLRFLNADNVIEETGLYTPAEINNIITGWKLGELSGSFGIGTILASNASYTLCEE